MRRRPRAYDEALREVSPAARRSDTARGGAGVYSYVTSEGVRWRSVVRRSDGSQTSKRGFRSQRAAADARRLVEQVERHDVVHTTETFGRYWERWLARRRPYLEDGTWSGYEINGRRRLLPAFADKRLGALSAEDIGPSSLSKPRQSRPASSRPRRSTTPSSRSWSASTTPSSTG